jgi:hypothetical protein
MVRVEVGKNDPALNSIVFGPDPPFALATAAISDAPFPA